MKKLIGQLAVLCLVLAVTLPVQAQEKKAKGKAGQKGRQPQAVGQLMNSLEKAELSADQKKAVQAIVKKYGPQLAAIQKERVELIGADAQKKMAAARKEASEAGKKGKELQAAVEAAAGLSPEKLEGLKALQKKTLETTSEMKKEVVALLSDEQKKAAGLDAKPARKKKKDTDNV